MFLTPFQPLQYDKCYFLGDFYFLLRVLTAYVLSISFKKFGQALFAHVKGFGSSVFMQRLKTKPVGNNE